MLRVLACLHPDSVVTHLYIFVFVGILICYFFLILDKYSYSNLVLNGQFCIFFLKEGPLN